MSTAGTDTTANGAEQAPRSISLIATYARALEAEIETKSQRSLGHELRQLEQDELDALEVLLAALYLKAGQKQGPYWIVPQFTSSK